MGNSISLEEELVNLKITSKQMQRAAKKCEKNEKAAVNKLKKVCTDVYLLLELFLYCWVVRIFAGMSWCIVTSRCYYNSYFFRIFCIQWPSALFLIQLSSFLTNTQAIAQRNSEGARIYAQDAIREKNQVSSFIHVYPLLKYNIVCRILNNTMLYYTYIMCIS